MQRLSLRAPTPGKRTALLACVFSWHVVVSASDVLPSYLTGTWGTAETLHAGETGQAEIHLQPDGLGIMAGSAPPARRIDGKDDGKPGLRAIAGFPLRATAEGDTLTARPVALFPQGEEKARRTIITCSFEAAGPTLTCTAPGHPHLVMKRRSETIPEESVRMIEAVRSRLR